MGHLQRAPCPSDPTGQLTLSSPAISFLTINDTTLGKSALGWKKIERRGLSCLIGKQSQDTKLPIPSVSGLASVGLEPEQPWTHSHGLQPSCAAPVGQSFAPMLPGTGWCVLGCSSPLDRRTIGGCLLLILPRQDQFWGLHPRLQLSCWCSPGQSFTFTLSSWLRCFWNSQRRYKEYSFRKYTIFELEILRVKWNMGD